MTDYLSESIVQKEAIAWLQRYYTKKQGYVRTAIAEEAYIKRGYTKRVGRADGLVALCNEEGKLAVASLEAKSHKTLGAIIEGYDDSRWFKHALFVGFVFSVAAVLATSSSLSLFWRIVLPILAFCISSFIFLVATESAERYRFPWAYQQLQRYPANYQWLAFCVDVFLELDEPDRNRLLRLAKSKKLGVLTVKEEGVVYPIIFARKKRTPLKYGSYLDIYTKGEELSKEILSRSS
jgi:hypothetical protein